MLAVVYHGPDQLRLEKRSRPTIQAPTDAIVRITKTTICGTDLAILKGGVDTVDPGRIIGHEGVGIVESVGSGVAQLKPGDRVLISCITACGYCQACRRGIPSNCANGGWILGNTIDGCQADYVRVPFADNGLYHIPDCIDEEVALMLSDILPTGLEVGVMNGDVAFGDVVAIVGAGPVGLAALLTVQFFAPAEVIVVDVDDYRLALAKKLGATAVINNRDNQAKAEILALTNGRGVDTAIEAVGHPLTCKLVQEIIGMGGTIANIGVYSESAELHKQSLWVKNITIRMGVVNTTTIPLLLKTIQGGKLDPGQLVTHRFPFREVLTAYEIFRHAAREQAVKIVLNTGETEETAVARYSGYRGYSEEDLIEMIVGQVVDRLESNRPRIP
ncbi:MAG: zinc-dependent alcohol dehydrogenase family protein [Chloroflexota bacterium]